jgi:hypothetical protein
MIRKQAEGTVYSATTYFSGGVGKFSLHSKENTILLRYKEQHG